jgi:hypothetical protein
MLHNWDHFYILAGTAAATAIGLVFVIITLVNLSASRATKGIHAFVTPTLVHFGGVLLQTLILLAPWPSVWALGIILGLCGLVGLAYDLVLIKIRRKLEFASLDVGRWIAYTGVPALTQMSLIAGAAGLIAEKSFAPYAIFGAIIVLLFAAIRDAWDVTLWIAKNRTLK